MAEDVITPSAQALLTCLQQQMLANPNPPQHFELRVGSDPVAADADEYHDYCCEGFAYVRVLRRFPAGNQWPIADELASNCLPSAWGVELAMGSFRCTPLSMGAAAWEETFTNVQNDQEAMVQAICCWVNNQEVNNPCFLNWMPREWEPFAVQGSCSGGEMTVLAQFQGTTGC